MQLVITIMITNSFKYECSFYVLSSLQIDHINYGISFCMYLAPIEMKFEMHSQAD